MAQSNEKTYYVNVYFDRTPGIGIKLGSSEFTTAAGAKTSAQSNKDYAVTLKVSQKVEAV